MMKRAKEAVALAPTFDALGLGWLTWAGLLVAILGWAMLLAGAVLADMLIARFPHLLGPGFHSDFLDIARCLIVSGFGLAIVGALHAGFGTLNRFFGAVLMRSAQRDNEPQRPVEPSPVPTPSKRRPYRMFADGTVEVDTIVGTRLFKSMAEAREFI
jgi:hypothetical protein